jgi:hypothetical protein
MGADEVGIFGSIAPDEVAEHVRRGSDLFSERRRPRTPR